MKLLALSIDGFRGIRSARIVFGDHNVLIGANGSGKSTVIDALSLVFGRTRLVRDLTEHDFYGSCPAATSRIRIVATLGGFIENDPDRSDTWFREGRAVPKWWDKEHARVEPERSDTANELCAQVAFVARFDLEELVVDQLRCFLDDDAIADPFLDDNVLQLPYRLLDDVGYYVLPARRTWDSTASFASELFRRAVATIGGIPATAILDERDRLRNPQSALETDPIISPLVDRINARLMQLLPDSGKFRMKVTATDSDSLLHALVAHYQKGDEVALPVGRHGMGLLSLQTFILLIEIGRERRKLGKSFLLAMEEPELHLPPGLQRRLVAQAISVAEQTICTSHSPRVAGFYPPTSVQLLEQRISEVAATPLLAKNLDTKASNAARRLYYDDRPRVVEALMSSRVLIPEGRSEYEWFRLLTDVLETGSEALTISSLDEPPFGAVLGVIPTHESAVTETFQRLRKLRDGLVPLVDGDLEGSRKILELFSLDTAPSIMLQWRDGWSIEDAIEWILMADVDAISVILPARFGRAFTSVDDLVAALKVKTGAGRLKGDFLAYQDIAAIIGAVDACRARAMELLSALTRACSAIYVGCPLLKRDELRTTSGHLVLRICP